MIRMLHVDDSGRYAADLMKILQLPADWESTCIPADELKSAANSGHCAYQIASWANHIALQFPNDKIIITIHANIQIPCHVYGSYCYGVEILEAIRIHDTFKNEATRTDVTNTIQHAPVIMYSWAPAECLIRNRPENARIFSPGVTFVQLPFCDSELRDALFWAEQHNSVDTQLYAPFFNGQTAFSPDRTRHSQANRFGIGVMINALNKIYDNLPPDLLKLKPAGIKMPYMGADISRMLFNYQRKLNEIDLDHENDNLKVITNNLRAIAGHLSNKKIALIDDEAAEVGGLDGLGWKQAFEYLLLQTNVVDNLFSKQNYDANPKAHANQIARQISRGQYACVLLDIRFPKDQRGKKKDIKNTFGCRVLKAIRKKCPAMPIIVVTSINKTWRHNQLLNAGADAIWVKEGVDELRTPRESLHNIVRLLELIRRVTGASYSFLHALNQKLKELFKSIEKMEVWWLKDNKFQSASPGNVYNVDATVVQDILNDSIQLFRTYVKDITMNFLEDPRVLRKPRKRNRRQPERESEFAKMLIMRLAKIIEIVHGMTHESDHRKRVNSGLMGGYKKPKDNGKTDVDIQRGDWTGFWLYNLRNECAHHFPHIKYRLTTGENIFDGRSAQNFMAFLVAYLSVADIPLLSKDKRFYFEALAGDDNHNEPYQKTIVNGDYIQQLVNAGGVNNIPSFGQFLDAYYGLQLQFYQ